MAFDTALAPVPDTADALTEIARATGTTYILALFVTLAG